MSTNRTTKNETFLGALIKDTGKYVYPAIAEKGLEYVCPDCTKDLLLCKGTKIAPYFRHYVEANCTYYSKPTESQIHKDAKMLLKKLLDDKVPIRINRDLTCCDENNGEFEIPELKSGYSIVLEHRFEFNGLKIADVAYINDTTKKIICIFEIFNTCRTRETSRPGLWFELNAKNLIERAKEFRENGETTLELDCIRLECLKCIESRLKYEAEILEEQKKAELAKQKKLLYYKSLLKRHIESGKLEYVMKFLNCCLVEGYVEFDIPKFINGYHVEIDHVLEDNGTHKMVDVVYFDNNNKILCSFDISEDTSEKKNVKKIPDPYCVVNFKYIQKLNYDPNIVLRCLRNDNVKCEDCLFAHQKHLQLLENQKTKQTAQKILKYLIENNIPIIITRQRACCKKYVQIKIPKYKQEYNVWLNHTYVNKTEDVVYTNNKYVLCIFGINDKFDTFDMSNEYMCGNIPKYLLNLKNVCDLENLNISTLDSITFQCCVKTKEKCDECREKEIIINQDQIRKTIEANPIKKTVMSLIEKNAFVVTPINKCCDNVKLEMPFFKNSNMELITPYYDDIVYRCRDTGKQWNIKIFNNNTNNNINHIYHTTHSRSYLIKLKYDSNNKIVGGECQNSSVTCQQCIEDKYRIKEENKIKMIEAQNQKKKHHEIKLFVTALKKNNTIILSTIYNCCFSRSDCSIQKTIKKSNITVINDNIECRDMNDNNIYYTFCLDKKCTSNDNICVINEYINNGCVLKLITRTNVKKCNACSTVVSLT